MSKTLKISDGDLFINAFTGSAEEISGPTKLSQDIAESLLLHFDISRNYGNTMNVDGIQPSIIGQVSNLDVRERIQSAIDRLKTKQLEDDSLTEEEEIDKIETLDIEFRDSGLEVRFFLSVITITQQRVTAAGIIPLTPTKLSQVNPEDLFLLNDVGNPLFEFENSPRKSS